MKRLKAGKYECKPNELIEIRFFCVPDRANVHIRASNDGVHYSNVLNNSIRFMFQNTQITLWLQFAFLNAGTCLNQVVVVDNTPTKDDRITAMGQGGDTDAKILLFVPASQA